MFLYKRNMTSWTLREQVTLLRHLGNLLEKGYSLWHALEFLQLYATKEKQQQLHRAVEQLKNGGSLYSVFTDLRFHRDMLAYLFYAEQHGDIAFALRQGSIFLERKERHYRKLLQTLRYPIFLLSFLIGMLILFNTVLLPQFASLHGSVASQSSMMVDTILLFIRLLPYMFGIVLSLVGITIVLYYTYFRKLNPVTKMNYLLSIPILKSFCLSLNSHYFAVQMSSLLQGGLSVLEAFLLMEQQRHQPFFQSEATAMKRLLVGGDTLEHILQERPYYERELSYVVTHGQVEGALANELADYSEMVVEKLEARVSKLVLIMQPLLFSVIGLIVVLMYLAILLPMFQTMSSM
ncbi:competence type IV pilus assembly protein ComGB [Ectobacillus funiculus]|uniref:competence type IV pilus assembly protein ComGB n=1 Tax=Ectobacillus funiculus TaxID=137993 RepID=UPI00397A5F90